MRLAERIGAGDPLARLDVALSRPGYRHGQAFARRAPGDPASSRHIIEPHEEYSLAQYVNAAHRAVVDILARHRVPLFVGGTPLYLKALLRQAFSGPPADWNLRRELQRIAETHGPESLHARLAEVDPLSAASNSTRGMPGA